MMMILFLMPAPTALIHDLFFDNGLGRDLQGSHDDRVRNNCAAIAPKPVCPSYILYVGVLLKYVSQGSCWVP